MDYIYFTFNGVSSSRFNLMVQNKGEDLLFPSQPGFDNQIIAPIYQGATYLAGVNKKERVFNFNCWIDSISIDLVRELLVWLSVNKTGILQIGYNPNFQYKVKVNSISDFKHMAINGNSATANYEFTVSFVTIGNPSSESEVTYSLNNYNLKTVPSVTGPNYDNGCPVGFVAADGKFKILNYYSESLPLNIDIYTSSGFTINLNDVEYYNYHLVDSYTTLTHFTLDTQYGFVKVGTALVESLNYIDSNYYNRGAMRVPPGDSKGFVSSITTATAIGGVPAVVIQIDNSLNKIYYSMEDIAKGNIYLIVQDGSFGNESTPGLPDYTSETIWGSDENVVTLAANLAKNAGLCNTWQEWYALPYSDPNALTISRGFFDTVENLVYVEFLFPQPLEDWYGLKEFMVYDAEAKNSSIPNYFNTLNGVVEYAVVNDTQNPTSIIGIKYKLSGETPNIDTSLTSWGRISTNKNTREYYTNLVLASL